MRICKNLLKVLFLWLCVQLLKLAKHGECRFNYTATTPRCVRSDEVNEKTARITSETRSSSASRESCAPHPQTLISSHLLEMKEKHTEPSPSSDRSHLLLHTYRRCVLIFLKFINLGYIVHSIITLMHDRSK